MVVVLSFLFSFPLGCIDGLQSLIVFPEFTAIFLKYFRTNLVHLFQNHNAKDY